jgi:hypothetical protein
LYSVYLKKCLGLSSTKLEIRAEQFLPGSERARGGERGRQRVGGEK